MSRCWACNEEFGVDGVHICANTPFKIKPQKSESVVEMNDTEKNEVSSFCTVTRLMELADDYADRAVAMTGGPDTNDVGYYRQCLQDELQKLFAPLSDERPAFTTGHCDSVGASYGTTARATEAAHGIEETK